VARPDTILTWYRKLVARKFDASEARRGSGDALPARGPNLNAYAERWVRSVKNECLSKLILIGERSLRRALSEYVDHYHTERNHQGMDNILLLPRDTAVRRERPVQCREDWAGRCAIIIERRRDRAPQVQSGILTPRCDREIAQDACYPLSHMRSFDNLATPYELQNDGSFSRCNFLTTGVARTIAGRQRARAIIRG